MHFPCCSERLAIRHLAPREEHARVHDPSQADDHRDTHDQSPGHADVTEGSRGIWERLQYDWSDPNRVVAKTTDSNTYGGNSGHTYTYTRNSDGTTTIDYVVVRDGKNLKGKFLGFVLGSVGKSRLDSAFKNSIKAIEARNGASSAAQPT
jgi:hypothetical protein